MDITGGIVVVILLIIYAGTAGVSSWHTFRILNLRLKDYLVSGVSVILGIGAGVYSIVIY
jgi:hypothetical protein